MNDSLTTDQFDALAQIKEAKKLERPSACVSRNAKTLIGLKYVAYAKDGRLELTEKGQLTLFVKRCIAGLRDVASDTSATLDADVATFLVKKGHVVPKEATAGFEITQRGRESLADIDSKAG